VTGTPVAQSGITVIRTCDPNGCAASLPRVPGPCIVAFFSRARYRVGFPDTVAAFGVKCLDEAPDPILSTGNSNHHNTFCRQRRQGNVISFCCVSNLVGPSYLTGAGIQRCQISVVGSKVHHIAVQRDATVRFMPVGTFCEFASVPPDLVAGCSIQCDYVSIRS